MLLPVVPESLSLPQHLLFLQHELQNPSCARINILFLQCAVPDRLLRFLLSVAGSAGHGEIAACLKRLHPVVERTPVCDHHALESPFFPENVRQKLSVIAAVHSVELWIRTHHGRRSGLLHNHLECSKIKLPERSFIHLRIRRESSVFLAVRGKMLEARSDSGLLQSLYPCRAHSSGKERILREIFKISAAQRVPLDVDARSQHRGDLFLLRLFPDGTADTAEQIRIPALPCRDRGRKTGRRHRLIDSQHIGIRPLLAKPGRTVRDHHGRDAILRKISRVPEILSAAQSDLLRRAHLPENPLHPVIQFFSVFLVFLIRHNDTPCRVFCAFSFRTDTSRPSVPSPLYPAGRPAPWYSPEP